LVHCDSGATCDKSSIAYWFFVLQFLLALAIAAFIIRASRAAYSFLLAETSSDDIVPPALGAITLLILWFLVALLVSPS